MSLNPKKKRIAAAVLFLVALYLIWLGLSLVRYREPRVKVQTEQRGPFEIEGVYHIHTTFSDGRKTPEEIAAIAARQALDFIVLTDHGRPNLESLASQAVPSTGSPSRFRVMGLPSTSNRPPRRSILKRRPVRVSR
jgi:hypothetical protein